MSASKARFEPHVIVATALALAAIPGAAAGDTQGWQFGLTPYVWLPNIEATGDFEAPPNGGGQPHVEIGPVDYLERLELALMLAGEARKGSWAVRMDVVYVDFGHQRSSVRSVTGPGGVIEIPLDAGTETSLDGLEWQLTVGYEAIHTPSASVAVLGGVRLLDVSVSIDWEFGGPLSLLPQSGSLSQDVELWDAIVGTRGRVTFGNGRWFLPFHFDAGAGSSALTWQAFTGLGYAFSWGDVLAVYRHLEYDQKNGELLQGARLSGPAIGASFRF